MFNAVSFASLTPMAMTTQATRFSGEGASIKVTPIMVNSIGPVVTKKAKGTRIPMDTTGITFDSEADSLERVKELLEMGNFNSVIFKKTATNTRENIEKAFQAMEIGDQLIYDEESKKTNFICYKPKSPPTF